MHVNIISDNAVSPNFSSNDLSTTCAYPLSILLDDGSVCSVYREGPSKHSPDSRLVMQTSIDSGVSWSNPRVIFDGQKRTPKLTVVCSGVCQTKDQELLVVFGAIEGLKPDVYMFDEEGRKLPHFILMIRSSDGGLTWSEPKSVPHPNLLNAGVTSSPFTLADGQLCIPLEYKLKPEGPNGTAMVFSQDNGETFEAPIIVASDASGKLNLCDGRFATLPNGQLIALLWTFDQDTEETIEVRSCFSSDGGRHWTEPQKIGFVGQITVPLVCSDEKMLAVSNYRLPPEGIQLWGSVDAGQSWGGQGPIQMWDRATSQVIGQPIEFEEVAVENEGIWDALDRFTFGTPDLVNMNNGRVLLTYYATLNGVTHVRACQFEVKWD